MARHLWSCEIAEASDGGWNSLVGWVLLLGVTENDICNLPHRRCRSQGDWRFIFGGRARIYFANVP